MAVSKVKIVSMVGLLTELDKVIKVCGQSEVFQPDDAMKFYSTTKHFVPLSEVNPFTNPLRTLTDTINSAGIEPEFVDIKNFKVDKKEILEYVDYLSKKLGSLTEKKEQLLTKIKVLNASIDQFSHFTGQDLNLKKIFSSKFIKVRFGRLPVDSYKKLISYQDDNPYIMFFPCTNDENYYWGVYFSPLENAHEIDRIFARLQFERIRVDDSTTSPEERLKTLKKQINLCNDELSKLDKKIDLFIESQKDQCMRFYSKLHQLNTYFGIKKYVFQYKSSFILVGWVPEDNIEDFKEKLEGLEGIEYSIENAEEELKLSPPVKLKNKKLFKPFEFFVDMYGLPSYDEFDPTAFIAIMYIILFGIMFGDLGQGIIVSIVGAIMWKKKRMDLGRIMISCGISASVFGIVFGSVFGFEHMLDPLYKSLGFSEKPIEVMNPSMIINIIYASIAIGILLIIFAMFLNVYSALKRRKWGLALFSPNGLAGIVFYVSLIWGIIAQLTLNIPVMNIFYILFLLVLPLIIIFLNGPLSKLIEGNKNWQPESWGSYIMENLFELFEVFLSYVTNTVSFLRVGAFVLVHAGMMMVVMTLAQMIGSGNIISIGGMLTVIIGNGIVIALEALLVGIQVLRIGFYEMFSRFFEGQGRAFKPVAFTQK